MPIEEVAVQFRTIVEWIVGIGTALGILWGWIGKPLRSVKKEMLTFEKEVKSQVMDVREAVGNIAGSTDFLIGDRLAQAHTYWIHKGYCPPADKARLVEMHKIYVSRGLNHLYSSYEQDILELPDEPPNKDKV